MQRSFFSLSCALILFFTMINPGYSQNGRTVNAVYYEGVIQLDGYLHEGIWTEIEPVTDFFQREPVEGGLPSQRTEVRIIYDDSNIYIGVKCFDSNPERIIRNEMKRGGDLAADDTFWIAFDTFSDNRSAYAFITNPNGARLDKIIRGLNITNENWDGIWDAAAAVTSEGWSAEIMIPFKTLRYPNNREQNWRINFGRNIRRNSEEVLWTGWSRNDGYTQLARYGVLEGLVVEPPEARAEFKPYILGGREYIAAGDNNTGQFNYGFDLKYSLSSNLTLDLTTKTDFAQIEVDREQINLTQMNTRYDEKRDFFLEGVDIFNYANHESRIQTFNSRSIGLTPDRQQLPVLAGGKLTGRIGNYQIGVLDLYTEDYKGFPATNYAVARVKRNLFTSSYVGLLATNLNNENRMHQSYGLDFAHIKNDFLGENNLQILGFFSGTFNEEKNGPSTPNSKNTSGKLQLLMPNDQYRISVFYRYADKNFDPEMGFIYRHGGIQKFQMDIDLTPRSSLPFIRRWIITPFRLEYDADMDGRLLLRNNRLTLFGFVTSGQDEVTIDLWENYEYIADDFNMFGDTIIPKGIYRWWNWRTRVNTSAARPVSVSLQNNFGDYYDGQYKNINFRCLYKGNQYFAVSADMAYNEFSFPGREGFITRDYGGRFILNFSTRLSSSTLLQWNNDTGRVNMNFRMHYIPVIGSDIYFVYNHLWDENDRFSTLENRGIIKANWLWRF